jgi:hypothetical protein
VDGRYYGVTDKHGAQVIVMSKATWEQLGTIIEMQKRSLEAQDKAIKQQSAHIQQLTADRDDCLMKLTNLRGNHRELLRERVEAGLVDPTTEAQSPPGISFIPQPKDLLK